MSRREEIAAERKASANFERRRQERHAREAAAIEAKRAKLAGNPGRRVPFDDDKAWIKVTNAPPSAPAPKPSRFKAVIDDAAQRSVAERVGRSVVGGGFPIFGPPPELGPGTGAVGPFPAGPRREATPYSGGRRAATPYSGGASTVEAPREDEAAKRYAEFLRLNSPNPPSFPQNMTPAEEWQFMRPRGGDALSDYYARQEDANRQRAAAAEEEQRRQRIRMESAIATEEMLANYRRERDRLFGR